MHSSVLKNYPIWCTQSSRGLSNGILVMESDKIARVNRIPIHSAFIQCHIKYAWATLNYDKLNLATTTLRELNEQTRSVSEFIRLGIKII